MKYYVVTFDTKKGGDKSYIINVSANTISEAKAKASQFWCAHHHKNSLSEVPHMFHVKARVLKPEEEFLYHWFVETK